MEGLTNLRPMHSSYQLGNSVGAFGPFAKRPPNQRKRKCTTVPVEVEVDYPREEESHGR